VFYAVYKYCGCLSPFHATSGSTAVMQSEMSRRPGRLKPPEISTSLDSSASHRDEVRIVMDMLDDITATTRDVVRQEARFFHTDANICKETYRDQCYYLIGKRHGFTYAGQSVRFIDPGLGRHHATRCIHHSVVQSLLGNIQIVSRLL
jgi:hypothetical protein